MLKRADWRALREAPLVASYDEPQLTFSFPSIEKTEDKPRGNKDADDLA